MGYCVQCGSVVTESNKFCKDCGLESVPGQGQQFQSPSSVPELKPQLELALRIIGPALPLVGIVLAAYFMGTQPSVLRSYQHVSIPAVVSRQTLPSVTKGPATAFPYVRPMDVPDDVGEFLQTWRNSFLARNFDVHTECYAPLVETYYQKHGLSRAEVRREREGMVAQYGSVRQFDVSNVELADRATGRVDVRFRTHWELSGKEYFAGEDTEKLTLIQTGGRWLITSEEEPTIYWVKKGPHPVSDKPDIDPGCKGSGNLRPCSESVPSGGFISAIAKGVAPATSGTPATSDPAKTVLDAFDAYIDGNAAGVTNLMSEEGARNAKTLCPGDAATCLRKNYSPFGSFQSRSAEVISHDAVSAKVRLMSNWQKADSSEAIPPQCQTYDLVMTGVGWRINSFSWPVPKSCY